MKAFYIRKRINFILFPKLSWMKCFFIFLSIPLFFRHVNLSHSRSYLMVHIENQVKEIIS